MARVGPVWGRDIQGHVRLMTDAFSELHRSLPAHPLTVRRDQPYGTHARQVLDVYETSPSNARAPILLFVHGGAFVDGSKDRTPEVYSNVCKYFARHGIVAINVEFRLAPEAMFPAGTEDVEAALAWTRGHAHSFGGDAQRVFLMGHSAGAAHAGLLAYRNPAPAGVAGLIVVSGRVRCENSAENPNARRVEAYFGTDPARMEEGSVVNHVSPAAVPTMVAIAEHENPLIDVHCLELAHRLAQAQRRAPRLLWLAGHNHTSIIAHVGTQDDRLGQAIRRFIAAA